MTPRSLEFVKCLCLILYNLKFIDILTFLLKKAKKSLSPNWPKNLLLKKTSGNFLYETSYIKLYRIIEQLEQLDRVRFIVIMLTDLELSKNLVNP